ncbi:MAG: 7TM diverse intracellular signaling domain-containing protein [Polyangiaceae bacterium]
MFHHFRLQRLAFVTFAWVLGLLSCSCRGVGPDLGNGLSLADRIEIFEDPSASLTLDEVTAPKNTSAFRPRPGPLNLGVTQSASWIRIDLHPDDFARETRSWVISVAPQFIGVTVYARRGGLPWRELVLADFARKYTSPLAFDIEQHREGETHLLFRVQGEETLFFVPRLQTGDEHVEEHAAVTLRKGVYYGVLGGAIVYNLFLAFWLRDRAYLLYVLFEAAYCASVASIDRTLVGLFPSYRWAVERGFTERFMCVAAVLAVLFSRDFLDLRTHPRVQRWALFTTAIGAVLVVLPHGVAPYFGYGARYAFIIYVCLSIIASSVFSLRRGNANAFLFLVAWGLVFLAATLGSLTYLGFLMPTYSVIGSLQVGSAVEAMLLAFALARRMNLIKRAEEIARLELADARLRLSQTLQRQVTSLNTLVGGVAHEIGNPLNFATGGAKDVVRRIHQADELASEIVTQSAPAAASSLRDVLQSAGRSAALAARGTERIESIVRNLRSYVGAGAGPAEPTDLDGCIRSTVGLLDGHLRTRNVDVRLELGIQTRARCAASEINQVIMNLLLNASHAMSDGGIIVIRSDETADHLRIVVTDNGPGVPPAIRRSIFDPFFTTRAPNEGTGLGLAVSAEIARRHGGNLELLPSDEGGTSGAAFALTLPRPS